MTETLEFTFRGMPVGYFEDDDCPRVPGKYRYMPYRGPGHFDLQEALDAGQQPRCLVPGCLNVSFLVVSCPDDSILELADFGPPGGVA